MANEVRTFTLNDDPGQVIEDLNAAFDGTTQTALKAESAVNATHAIHATNATNATLAEASKGIIFPLVTSYFEDDDNIFMETGMRVYWSNYSENARLTVIMDGEKGYLQLYDFTSSSVIHEYFFTGGPMIYEQNVEIPSGHVVGIRAHGRDRSWPFSAEPIKIYGAYLVSI